MESSTVRFNSKHQNEFFDDLKSRISLYFKENNKTRHGNLNMKIKTIFMLCLLIAPFVCVLTLISSSLGFYLMWVLMGFGTAGIGLSVMHDANHGSYSTSKRVNDWVGYLFNMLGSYHINWKIQHNVLHHTYTNVSGHDEDIEAKIIRLSPDQERKPLFKFQAYYATFFYSIMTIYWILIKDFEQLSRYNQRGLLKGQGTTYTKALTYALLIKVCYFTILFAGPLFLTSFTFWQVLTGWLIMHLVVGTTLSFIFQLAHVLGRLSFPNHRRIM
jgi:linoleoyl-CoA desaturase